MALFAYNNGVSASTGHSPFFLNYSYHPRHNISPNAAKQIPAAKKYLEKLAGAQERAAGLLKKAQKTQAVQYNCKRQETPAFEEEELAWLLQKYVKTKRPSTKLDDKKLGPFAILEKIKMLARRLNLPVTMKIHPVFHVSLLEPFKSNPKDPKISCPDPVEVYGEEEYRVKKILDSRIGGRGKKQRRQYLVKWKGYPSSKNTWEDKKNVKKAEALDVSFRKKIKTPRVLAGLERTWEKLEGSLMKTLMAKLTSKTTLN